MHSYIFGHINNTNSRILCDSGAFCNCISLQFYNRIKHKNPITPKAAGTGFKAANNETLDVLGTVELNVKIAGLVIPVEFHVIRNLMQNCILGGTFFEETSAVINYGSKTLSLYQDTVSVALLNDVDVDKILHTTTKLRIPAQSEVIFNAKLNRNLDTNLGITETLPSALNQGLLVAHVLLDTSKNNLTCRMMNTTHKTIYVRKNFAFAYLDMIDSSVGVNLINITDDETDSGSDMQHVINDNKLPDHEARLKYLLSIGVDIGTDVLSDSELQDLTKLLYNYRDVFAFGYKDVPVADVPPHKIKIIDEKVVTERRFRYNPEQERLLEERCDELLDAGMLKPSNSLYNSPVFLLNQKGGKAARFLVDFRRLNQKVEPQYCSLPTLEDVFDLIGDEKPTIYSVADIRSGYFGIALDEESSKFTAFSTKSRHLEFTRLPQGYRNSPTAFTQALSNIFAKELRSNLLIYVDDMFMFSKDGPSHIKLLENILAKFRRYKLRLHPSKLHIAMRSVNFLGYEIGQNGYTCDSSRTSVVQNYPTPRNPRDIKRFLGLCNYFRRTIKNYSKRAEPLRRLLSSDSKFEWTDAQESSFNDLKYALCNPPILGFPSREKPLRLTLDGSANGLGYILSNVNADGTETVLHYGARATTKAEKHYSATDLELAALLTGIKTFSSYLINTKFEVLSDHVSLTYIRNLKFGTSRLVRASILLSQYDFTIKHLSGKTNTAADALSRVPNIQADNLTILQQKKCNSLLGEEQLEKDDGIQCQNADQEDFVGDTNADSVTCVNNNVSGRCSHYYCEFPDVCDVICADSKADRISASNSDTACNNVECDATYGNIRTNLQQTNESYHQTETDRERQQNVTGPDSHSSNIYGTATADYENNFLKQQNKTQVIDTVKSVNAVGSKRRKKIMKTNIQKSATASTADTDTARQTNDQTADFIDSRTTQQPQTTSTAQDATISQPDTTADSDHNIDASEITLASQSADQDFCHIINYLVYGSLPDNDKLARRVTLLSDYFCIEDGKLYHLMVSRRKNTSLQQNLMKQLCIPKPMRSKILQRYHVELMHLGSEKTYLTLRNKIYWPNFYEDIRDFVASCETCHKVKADTHAKKAKIQTREIPETIFHTIHVDHLKISVKNVSHPYNYVLIIVDTLSLNIELIPTKTTSAKETAEAIFKEWFCRYGVPSFIISDRHKAFTADLTQTLFKLCGAKHIPISVRNPQSNGLCEQVNNRVINALKIHCNDNQNWPKILPAISASYRAAISPTRQYSPFFILYGCDMQLPTDSDFGHKLPATEREINNAQIFRDRMQILRSNICDFAGQNRQKAIAAHNKTKTAKPFEIGQKVYLSNETLRPTEDKKTALRFTGPFVILAKSQHNTYKLSHVYTGKVLRSFVHGDKLRHSHEARKTRKNRAQLSDEDEDDITDISGTTADVDRDTASEPPVSNTDSQNLKVTDRSENRTENDTTAQIMYMSEPLNADDVARNASRAYYSHFVNSVHDGCPDDDVLTTVEDSAIIPQYVMNINRLHNRANEMKAVIAIRRVNHFSISTVKLHNGETLSCRTIRVPCKLLCKFRLQRYNRRKLINAKHPVIQ